MKRKLTLLLGSILVPFATFATVAYADDWSGMGLVNVSGTYVQGIKADIYTPQTIPYIRTNDPAQLSSSVLLAGGPGATGGQNWIQLGIWNEPNYGSGLAGFEEVTVNGGVFNLEIPASVFYPTTNTTNTYQIFNVNGNFVPSINGAAVGNSENIASTWNGTWSPSSLQYQNENQDPNNQDYFGTKENGVEFSNVQFYNANQAKWSQPVLNIPFYQGQYGYITTHWTNGTPGGYWFTGDNRL